MRPGKNVHYKGVFTNQGCSLWEVSLYVYILSEIKLYYYYYYYCQESRDLILQSFSENIIMNQNPVINTGPLKVLHISIQADVFNPSSSWLWKRSATLLLLHQDYSLTYFHDCLQPDYPVYSWNPRRLNSSNSEMKRWNKSSGVFNDRSMTSHTRLRLTFCVSIWNKVRWSFPLQPDRGRCDADGELHRETSLRAHVAPDATSERYERPWPWTWPQ